MAQVKIINKSKAPPQEPVYNTTDQVVDNPIGGCPLKENKDKEPVKKIIKSYFLNEDCKSIQEITTEKWIYFTIESENMKGEEVFVDLQFHPGDFEYDKQQIDSEKLLKIKIEDDVDMIELVVLSRGISIPASKISKVARAPKPPRKYPSYPAPKPPEAKIVSIDFLDGENTKVVKGVFSTQYVNLPRDEKWVDGKTIKNIDRLFRQPRILIKFDQKGEHPFFIKFIKHLGGIEYSAEEKNRNANFKYDDTDRLYTTENDGTKIISDLKINVAGGNRFKVIAEDFEEKQVESKSYLKVMRLFYIQELKMKGLTAVAEKLEILKEEYKRNHILLENLGTEEMEHMKNISDTDSNKFKRKIEAAISKSKGKDKARHCISIAYTDHLAVKNPDQLMRTGKVKVGPGERNVIIEIKAAGKVAGDTQVRVRSLWNNIDEEQGWFVSCSYGFVETYTKESDDEGKSTGRRMKKIEVPVDLCFPIPCSRNNTDDCEKVSIKVSSLPKGEGIITLRVNVVDRFRAGLAFNGKPYVVVCTKAWWQKSSMEEQNQVAIHEIGHKIQMVTDGSGKKPDKITTFYKNKGHVGPHCFNGNADGLVTYGTTEAEKKSTCVMFGSTNGKEKFCENCSPAVKKVDLSDGF